MASRLMIRRLSSLAVPAVATAVGLSIATSPPPAESQASTAPKGLSSVHPPTVVQLTRAIPGEAEPGITIEYFALRALGELPRLILESTGTPYKSVFHYKWPENSAAIWKSYAPFGQLPVLRDGALLLTESGAICRHLARKTCIDGSTLEEKALVDMYSELAKDIEGKKAAIFDKSGRPRLQLEGFLGAGEARLAKTDGKHFVGEDLTLADVAMFKALYHIEEVQPGGLSDYPKLLGFVKFFAGQPNIANYLASERRVPLTPNEVGDRPWKESGYDFLKPMHKASYATTWMPKGA
jgi:glutathione S-transferase